MTQQIQQELKKLGWHYKDGGLHRMSGWYHDNHKSADGKYTLVSLIKANELQAEWDRRLNTK